MKSDYIFLRLLIAFALTVFAVFGGVANGHWYGYAAAVVVCVLGVFMCIGGSIELSEAMKKEAEQARRIQSNDSGT